MTARKKRAEGEEQTAAETKRAEGETQAATRTKKAEGGEPAADKKKEPAGERDLTRDDIIRRYLDIYRRCMTEDPKSFDARGAANALEQISKLLGLTVSAKDTEGNEIVLKLSEEADALGQ